LQAIGMAGFELKLPAVEKSVERQKPRTFFVNAL